MAPSCHNSVESGAIHVWHFVACYILSAVSIEAEVNTVLLNSSPSCWPSDSFLQLAPIPLSLTFLMKIGFSSGKIKNELADVSFGALF